MHKAFVNINCWHLIEYESNLLWDFYSGKNGLAIQSTFGRARESFSKTPLEILGEPVTYIDFDEDWTPDCNILFPFVYKPKVFENERELRFIKSTFVHSPEF